MHVEIKKNSSESIWLPSLLTSELPSASVNYLLNENERFTW